MLNGESVWLHILVANLENLNWRSWWRHTCCNWETLIVCGWLDWEIIARMILRSIENCNQLSVQLVHGDIVVKKTVGEETQVDLITHFLPLLYMLQWLSLQCTMNVNTQVLQTWNHNTQAYQASAIWTSSTHSNCRYFDEHCLDSRDILHHLPCAVEQKGNN